MTIYAIYEREPNFPATDQHPAAARYTVFSAFLGRSVIVDAVGGEPTTAEVDEVLNPRSARVRRIEEERDAALAGGVLWNGKEWHLDATFQQHLTGLIAAFATGVLPPTATVPIRTRANTIEQLTYDQLKALAAAVLSRVQEIWAESWAKKDALG